MAEFLWRRILSIIYIYKKHTCIIYVWYIYILYIYLYCLLCMVHFTIYWQDSSGTSTSASTAAVGGVVVVALTPYLTIVNSSLCFGCFPFAGSNTIIRLNTISPDIIWRTSLCMSSYGKFFDSELVWRPAPLHTYIYLYIYIIYLIII